MRKEHHYEATDGVTAEFGLRGYFESPKRAYDAFIAAFGSEFADTALVYLSDGNGETYGMVNGSLCPISKK